MKGVAKGQSGLVTAVIALTIAVPLSSIPDFTVEYVTASAFEDMEKNSMRYQSAAHSYKFASQEVNNKINYSEVESDIYNSPSGFEECDMSSSKFALDENNVSFGGVSAGETFSNKGCTSSNQYVLEDTEHVYPAIPFFEVEDGRRNRVMTTVVP